MRLSEILTASVVAPLVAAHGGYPGAPKIIGLGQHDIGMLKNRNVLGGHAAHFGGSQQGPHLKARQEEGRCGKAFGCRSCAAGEGCSIEGNNFMTDTEMSHGTNNVLRLLWNHFRVCKPLGRVPTWPVR